ncbi:MAG: amino acid ABC transporter substrate-binding protein [Candidatus Dadabacteria bacterium]|nr:amino acid ABC transporter substrate-binding protein [Candidatus Dadabacteria bacterium]
MFWESKVDVIVIDESIMLWFTKHSSNNDAKVRILEYHDIFGVKTKFRVSFKDSKMRDDFNEGLKHIREKGIYQKIMDKYLK